MVSKRVYLLSLGIIFLAISCRKEIKYTKTESGLEYCYFEKSDTGSKGKPGYFYLVEMVGQREDDSVFIDSYKLGQKIKLVRTEPPFHSLFNDALGMLRVGDSIGFKMPVDSFFRPLRQAVPSYLKSSQNIRFTIKVKDILNPEAHLLKMYFYEVDKMLEYLKLKKWNYSTDSTGIKYEVIKKGEGVKAKIGDEVMVSYLLTYMDGKIIDRTKPGDQSKVIVGESSYISGLSRLILLAEENSKIRALLPFAEAFGENGSAYVDPYATLVIELDIHKIKTN